MATLQALTITGGDAALEQETIEGFAQQLRNPLILAEDDGYDEARTIYNGMIDKRPALIARCENVAEVTAAVNFAREHDLLVAVRGGGHNGPGFGSCDGGLVIDLAAMNGVRVNPDERTARVGGGATWGDVDRATNEFGLATVSGINSTTGVGGLTLGGGHGYLSRKYGLTIDNLLEADVVLADGRLVTASENANDDLFWALRGGGGNFGIVTSFKFRLHPVDTIVGGPTLWPLEQAPEVMRWFRDFTRDAPEDLYGFFAFLVVPPAPPFPEALHLQKMCGIVWCYTGPPEEADAAFAPVQRVGTPALHGVQSMPYPALQSAFDGLYPPGMQWYWKGDLFRELSDAAIAAHIEHAAKLPTMHSTMHSTMHLYPVNGAVHRVGKDETAWGYRDVTWSMVIAGVDPDPGNVGPITNWARSYWEALHPYSAGGAYLNFMMDEGPDRVRATYRDNYDRLAQVKAKYDPENRFRVNQNIQPAATG